MQVAALISIKELLRLQVVLKSLDQIIPYINNPRINEKGIDKVASSIKEFGFNSPIILDKDNVIIAGHTRYLAAQKLGLEEVPCINVEHLSPAQIKAYRIADNKVAEYSDWEDELLKLELEQLKEIEFDLSLTGFEEWETEHLLNPISEEDLQDFFVEKENKPKEPKKIKCPLCNGEFEK